MFELRFSKINLSQRDQGADPNAEDKTGATPLYLIFHPIEYKERMKYKDEKSIPKGTVENNSSQ